MADKKKLGFLGPAGTYTHRAAESFAEYLEFAELRPFNNIAEIIYQIEQNNLSYGVVPLENSIEGSVNITIDLLIQLGGKVKIIGEVVQKINHCLLGVGKLAEIKKIYSHPQAIGQCQQFLNQVAKAVQVQHTVSTGEAVVLAKKGGNHEAAIASLKAAELYQLPIIQEAIQDNMDNYTRFVLISKEESRITGRDKTLMVFTLPEDKPGGLYQVLAVFAQAAVNLTKIESRPTKEALGKYYFILECLGHASQDPLKQILRQLENKVANLSVLGSYFWGREDGQI